MPKVISLPSLFKLCLRYITRKCSEDSKFLDAGFFRLGKFDEVNPFHQLPISILEEIIRNVTKFNYPKPIKEIVLNRLLSKHLTRFYLPYFYIEPHVYIFDTLQKLQILILCGSEVGDSGLSVIGTVSKNLKSLNLKGCCNVTNTGIKLLCVDRNGEANVAIMKTLEQLVVFNTRVTKRGAQMAFKRLPALKYLCHETTFEILVNLAKKLSKQCYRQRQTIPEFPIRCLFIQKISPHGNGGLGLVVSVCPSLTTVIIDLMEGLTDKDLLSMIPLKQLRELRICNYPKEDKVEITFEGGVAPLLKEVGSSLQILDVIFFDVVNIWTIVKLCPNLISLVLNDHCKNAVRYFPENEPNVFPIIMSEYSTLKKLEICFGARVTPEVLFYLLSFPLLKTIIIFSCNALTDDLLQKVVNCHRLQNLKELKLSFCSFVSKKGVDALMTHHNPLQSISFRYCENLTPSNVLDWEKQARQNHWKLNLAIQDVGY